MKPVLIVGDGPSAATLLNLPIPSPVYVIAVNAAIQWLPRADAFFTLDPGRRNRWLMAHQRPNVEYFAAVPPQYGLIEATIPAHRFPRERGVTYFERVAGWGPLNSAPGMNPYPNCINTGNSAWGALGLAHHMGASKIGLIGVDGSKTSRVSGGRPYFLGHLPWLFSTYDGPAEIRNASGESAIECFPKSSIKEVLEWLITAQ